MDYDYWLLGDPDDVEEPEDCPICDDEFDNCRCTIEDIKGYRDEQRNDYLAERELERRECDDIESEVSW